ncbi:peptidylprolyl isomerase [Psychroserpens sp. XS_ASV72]|uniref:peptidylprolyl isomerase n=1 Tax=Psychroserpens sp. XS_ASV72 TaxID=3241293 RepID=UPI003519D3A6
MLCAAAFVNCNSQTNKKTESPETITTVEMVTNLGALTLELSNETPKHRDNFIKLITEKAYDSLLFHRVIENFVIQGGDPESKHAPLGEVLGEGDLNYTVEAEFRPNLFHKRGALATAREDNLDRSSSAMQFFIVHGKVYNDSLLEVAESRINKMTARHHIINSEEHKALYEAFKKAYDKENMDLVMTLNDSIQKLADAYSGFEKYNIPEAHRKVYKTIGGTPHLDQNYTVFGEVIEGMSVVDSIAKMPTDENDRPLVNVRILRTTIKGSN